MSKGGGSEGSKMTRYLGTRLRRFVHISTFNVAVWRQNPNGTN